MCHRRRSRSGWFWPDHFFGVLMKFTRAYYSRTTSEVLPMPLYVSNLLYGGLEGSGGSQNV